MQTNWLTFFKRLLEVKKRIFNNKQDRRFIVSSVIKSFIFVIVIAFPSAYWYKIELYLINWVADIYTLIKPINVPKRRIISYYLDKSLAYTTRARENFSIPYNIKGLENLDCHAGNLVCGSHLPLSKVGLKALIMAGFPIAAAVAGNPEEDLKMSVWGMKDKLNAFKVNSHVLLKVKTQLLQDNNVAAMIDNPTEQIYSMNSLRIAGMLGKKTVYMGVWLNEEGMVEVELFKIPFPFCRDRNEISANKNFIEQKHVEIESGYM